MSQNDMSLANANGATFRADVNSALQALASNNGGSSAPSTAYANQWWFDTGSDILKIRDEANANWVNVASLVGTTWIPYSNGSVLGTLANQNASGISTNLALSAKHIAFATTAVSSGTPDFATSGNVVSLSSTATANTLGTVQAGFIGVVHYGVAITITHNGTSRILPTGANITTAVGDVEIVLSLGSGNWRTIAYMRADGTALGAGSATKAQLEAASSTSTFASPGRQQYHPSAAKYWGQSTVSAGVPATPGGASFNVSSVTDVATGRATWNFTTAFSSSNYGAFGCTEYNSGSNSGELHIVENGGRSTTAVAMRNMHTGASSNATLQDPGGWHVLGFGTQA
jgi:hypothetical protein